MRFLDEVQSSERLVALLQGENPEPITLRENNRDAAVVLSPEQYRLLQASATQDLIRLCDEMGTTAEANGLTEEILNEILAEAKAERLAAHAGK